MPEAKNNFDVPAIQAQIKRWQEKLLDMSKSNPLLGLNRSRTAKFKITNPSALEVFQKLSVDEQELSFPFVKTLKNKKAKNGDELVERDEEDAQEKNIYSVEEGDLEVEYSTPADFKKKLRRIFDNSRTTLEERGVVTLYAAFGVIKWHDDMLGESVSPILLVPCEILYKGPNSPLKLHAVDEDVIINPAIKYYFKEKHKIEIPELPQERELSRELVEAILNEVGDAVKNQGWEVVNETWVGTFTFESLVLYQDLKLLTELACSNLLIAALAHSQVEANGSEALGDDLDAMDTPQTIPLPILPTDSSQLQALSYSAMGKNVVIFGPPGTGKSQTISNIIADALGKNKRVLFVSAKMAALNVVYDKLNKEGLGQFCLEAHSTKAGKLKIVEELKKTLELNDANQVGHLDDELETLKKTRQQLNDYVVGVNKVSKPIGLSAYQIIGKHSKMFTVPDVKAPLPWKKTLDATKTEIESCIDALREVANQEAVYNTRETHPWRGFENHQIDLQAQEGLERDFEFLFSRISKLNQSIKELSELFPDSNFNLDQVINFLDVLKMLLQVDSLPSGWQKKAVNELSMSESFFTDAVKKANDYASQYQKFGKFSKLSLDETIKLLSAIRDFGSFGKRFSIKYYKWRSQVKLSLANEVASGYGDLLGYYSACEQLNDLGNWFDENSKIIKQAVTIDKVKDATALEAASLRYKIVLALKEKLPDYNWSGSTFTSLSKDHKELIGDIVKIIEQDGQKLTEVGSATDEYWPSGFVDGESLSNAPLSSVAERVDEVLKGFNKIREWAIFRMSINRCADLGLTDFISSSSEFNADLLPSIFEKRLYYLWVNDFFSESEYLIAFTGLKHQELIEKFRLLDDRIRRLTKMHVRANAASSSKRIQSAQPDLGSGSEIGILRYEMQKRRKIKPLRKLFSEIPHVLQALKPCMLMSPISVSTYLKPESFHFDLVIFDEASQLPTPEAIPSILRADQVVVAGDSNQLPPTSFFQSSLINEDDDIDDNQYDACLESLLDDCVAITPIFQESQLKWHYRSRDERLINFSNHYFYENKLITFPSCDVSSDGRGVVLDYVEDGVWDKGKSRTNRKEARRVAKRAVQHFRNFPERTLGVVALNSSQREAIEDAIEEELKDNQDVLPFFDTSRHEAFFVKSLESVQGDERDVIMISVGYAKDKDGMLTMNFGPLNVDGGWRRLNVLVTRAKWQIILVTSLKSSELSRLNPQNRGAYSLKNFIEYAERNGELPKDPAKLAEIETNDFEDAIRQVLVDSGYIVDVQVGVGNFRIDLAIRDPRDTSKYLVGIECDGATYHSSRVARDRDILREEILKEMGWILHRVWSTEWFNNREAAINLMLTCVQRATSRDLSKSMPAPYKAKVIEHEFATKPAPVIHGKYKVGKEYDKFSRTFNSDILLKKQYSYTSKLSDVIGDILEVESPIHQEVLLERIKEVFKVGKVGSNIKNNLKTATDAGVRKGFIEIDNQFLLAKGKIVNGFRKPSDNVKRLLSQIHDKEISWAALYLVEDQFGVMTEQIPQAIAKLFGHNRVSADDSDRIRMIVNKLVSNKQLVLNGNQVNIGTN